MAKEAEPGSFEEKYPGISGWVRDGGWIEMGVESGGYCQSFVRALDEGGMVFEGRIHYDTMDEALRDLDRGIAQWLDENG